MIHSLCGGKLHIDETKVFAKVSFLSDQGGSGWFLAEDFPVSVGDRVVVRPAFVEAEGVVIEVVECKNNVFPVPLRSAKPVLRKI